MYRRGNVAAEYLLKKGIDQNDFGFVYANSRVGGLSRIESFYNALYIHSLGKFDSSKKSVSSELKNTFSHPKGWYRDSFYTWKNNFWSRFFSFLQYIPRIASKITDFIKGIPGALKQGFETGTAKMDNSFRVFVGICRFSVKLTGIILPIALSVLLYSYATSSLDNSIALDVYVNDEYIGAVESGDKLISARRMLEKNLSASIGDTFRFTDEISYSFVNDEDIVYLSDSEIYSALYNAAKGKIHPGYGLYVDGVLVVASENRPALDRAVDEIREYYKESVNFYAEENNIKLSYANDISIIPKDFPVESLCDEEKVREILGLPPIETNSVLPENFIYHIYYTSVTSRIKSNENESEKNLTGSVVSGGISEETDVVLSAAIGNAVSADVTLEYVITKEVEVEEDYPYEIEMIESDKYLLGSQKVEKFGKDGYRKAVYAISYLKGEEISRELISEEIIKPAVNKLIYIGTRIPTDEELRTTATGSFIIPYDGYVSSGYGLRKVNKFGTREFHNAWDIPGPYGSPILAADGGRVSFVGYTSGYGLHVIIDHENGYETVYAHLSKALVKAGDRVGKEDVIAKMGASGRVTGVHVHFEIRKDGATIDPDEFLDRPER